MRTSFIIPTLAAASLATAQITIDHPDMPAAGDTMHYRTAASIALDLEYAGPGVLWDASDLISNASDADVAVPVQSTPLAYQFYFNNPFLYPDHHAAFALEGMDFDLQVLTIQNVYEYYKNDEAGYRNVGFGAMFNGLPNSVRRIPVDHIYRFPMNFGDVDSSFSSWETSVPTLFYLKQDQWRHNTVDGWGTLYLPTDTFEVLRIRSVLARRDTIYVEQFGTGIAIDEPETVEYKWLAAGMGMPVLSVTTVGGETVLVRFAQEAVITSVAAIESKDHPWLHPNPVDDHLHLRIPDGSRGTLVIRDAQGSIVFSRRNFDPISTIPTSGFAPGQYTISFIEGGMIRVDRFMVAH